MHPGCCKQHETGRYRRCRDSEAESLADTLVGNPECMIHPKSSVMSTAHLQVTNTILRYLKNPGLWQFEHLALLRIIQYSKDQGTQ